MLKIIEFAGNSFIIASNKIKESELLGNFSGESDMILMHILSLTEFQFF